MPCGKSVPCGPEKVVAQYHCTAMRCILRVDGILTSCSSFRVLHGELNLTEETMSPSKREFQIQMSKKLNGGALEEGRVLSFQAKPPSALEVIHFFIGPNHGALFLLFFCFALPVIFC